MGILGLGKKKESTASMQNGSTNLNIEEILAIDGSSYSPTNAGKFGIQRSHPVVKKIPEKFTQRDLNQLKAKRAEHQKTTEHMIQGFKEVAIIHALDASQKEAHNKYIAEEANQAARQVASNAKLGKALSDLQPKYAGIAEGLHHSLNMNQARVAAIGFALNQKAKEYQDAF
jgi:hypothetical protein